MRNVVWIFLGLILISSCGQSGKTNDMDEDVRDTISYSVEDSVVANQVDSLAEAIYGFIRAYQDQNDVAVNTMIHPDLGLKIIYRPGVSDTFVKVNSFDFKNPIPSHYSYPKLKGYSSSLNYATLPEFDCGTEKWNKRGVYCDTINQPKQLSLIMTFEREFEPNKYSKSMIQKITEEEKGSYRVIVTGDYPLIFHLRKHQGAWYITVLDRAYATCDA